MAVDPVASLRPADIDVEVGDWEYTVPALTAAEWIELMAGGGIPAIVPGLLGTEDRMGVMRDYLDGNITKQDLEDACRRVLEVAGGRKWWEVERLVDSAIRGDVWPTIHGQLVLKGVDLDRLTLAGFVNAVWVMALQNCQKESEKQALEWELTKPPPGFVDEMEETDESEFESILAEQARLTGG